MKYGSLMFMDYFSCSTSSTFIVPCFLSLFLGPFICIFSLSKLFFQYHLIKRIKRDPNLPHLGCELVLLHFKTLERLVKPFSYSKFCLFLFFLPIQFQVSMVKITERVVNTYFARLFFSKVRKRFCSYGYLIFFKRKQLYEIPFPYDIKVRILCSQERRTF